MTSAYKYKNIEPHGDPFVWRKDNDGITRFGYRNIGGTTLGQGFEVVDELEAIAELGIDVQGYSEINKPWSSSNKWQYDAMMDILFTNSQTVYSAMKADHDTNYQPGGNLLTVNGDTTGRINDRGGDPLGRFCWFTLRGKRDEGIIVITAYRVCHEKSDNPGPYTAFSQQYSALRESGVKDPNPRKQVLQDLTTLIDQKRKEGYRPVVMMDANGDYTCANGQDRDLAQFVQDNNLVDEYHNRFPEQINTYIYGSKRLDYIFVDPALVDSIERIGYLGSHEGTFSDHVQAYVDFKTDKLFRGHRNTSEAQKQCEEGRVEWLKEEARRRAEASDKDTERVYKDMCRIAETRTINRKLTCILKPRSGAIDRIEIPTHDWFHSAQSNEFIITIRVTLRPTHIWQMTSTTATTR